MPTRKRKEQSNEIFTETKTGFKGQLKRYFSKAAKSDLEAAGEIAVSLNVGRIIPLGRENAVKRTTLSNQLGRTDREVRKWIEGLRREIPILNFQDGRGYFQPDNIKDVERWIRQEEKRIRMIQASLTGAKRWCERYYKNGGVTDER